MFQDVMYVASAVMNVASDVMIFTCCPDWIDMKESTKPQIGRMFRPLVIPEMDKVELRRREWSIT